jgi:hypothetical protein
MEELNPFDSLYGTNRRLAYAIALILTVGAIIETSLIVYIILRALL